MVVTADCIGVFDGANGHVKCGARAEGYGFDGG